MEPSQERRAKFWKFYWTKLKIQDKVVSYLDKFEQMN